jgi:uncharacterized protein YbaR (Trm112 family)
MTEASRVPISVRQLLRCPVCRSDLRTVNEGLTCRNHQCGAAFPVVRGVPILINEKLSVFPIEDFVRERETFFRAPRKPSLRKAIDRLVPQISSNVRASQNYARFVGLLTAQTRLPRVLVLGGSRLGAGMQSLAECPSIQLVETDVSFGPRTVLICDAHDIPFPDRTFDGVVAQAVLEHVVDPYRCVEEMHRVLKGRGLVYAETAFMQQVHGGAYDFTRFTALGHRRVFRRFEEVGSGAVCGPGMALASAYTSFLVSLAGTRLAGRLAGLLGRLSSFCLKYFDSYLVERPEALGAASALYFMGRKSTDVISDREIVALYRGQ